MHYEAPPANSLLPHAKTQKVKWVLPCITLCCYRT